MAKRWPDEQEADTRRRMGVRWPYSSKPGTCTERCVVDPTGISVKESAQYPGRSECVPLCYGHRELLGGAFRSQPRPS